MHAHAQTLEARPRAPAALFAGLGAGLIAALATAGAERLMGVRIPPIQETAWSAFAAGVGGGLLYALLVRLVRRPAAALWALSLAMATADSLLVAMFPLPAGRGIHVGIPIDGLIVPVRQLAALVGLGRFGGRHFPAAFLPADTVLHYIPAVAVGLVVPRWTGIQRPRSGGV